MIFLLGFAISFVGSLPFGMINMAVAHTAIRRGMGPALAMAAGASLIELVQAFVSLKFTAIFTGNPVIERVFEVIAAIAFLAGGIYFFFFAKTAADSTENEPPVKRRHEFMKGVFLSTINVMAIPYWIFYGALLAANGWLNMENLPVAIFSLGTMAGTFTLLVLYSLLGVKILRRSAVVTRWVNRFIGLVLLGFAMYTLAKMAGAV
jgi:threonine/homoserine/homoserine lactone efflux protein